MIQDITTDFLDNVYNLAPPNELTVPKLTLYFTLPYYDNLAPPNELTVPKLTFYFTLPYYDQLSESEAHDLIKTLSRLYPNSHL